MGDVAQHEPCAVGVVIVELCRRNGLPRQAVFVAIGEEIVGVSPRRFERVARLPAVGCDERTPWMSAFCVDLVVYPCSFVIIDMGDHQAPVGQVGVPSLLLAVLQQVEFVFVGVVVQDVGFAVLAYGLLVFYDGVAL